jgi:hypothetical protein
MKARSIEYLDGDFTFKVPADWVFEFDPETGGMAYHPEDESAGCLEVSVLSARMKADAKPESTLDSVRPREDEDVVIQPRLLPTGDALSVCRSEFEDDDGAPWVSHTFLIANEPAPRLRRIAILTFSAAPRHGAAELAFFLEHLPRSLFNEVEDPDEGWEEEEIDAEGQSIALRKKEVDAMPEAEFRPLSESESNWMAEQASIAEAIAARHASAVPEAHDALGQLRRLDAAFAHWTRAKEGKREADDVVANSFGAAFGEICRRELGLNWRHVTDEWGVTYALRCARENYTMYPISSVEKRIEDGASGFFEHIFLMAREQLADAATH